MCIACGGFPSEENNPCGLCGVDRNDLTDEASISEEARLLRRSSEVLKGIRLKAANWQNYPGAAELLNELYQRGYA